MGNLSKRFTKKETARQAYIRMLKDRADFLESMPSDVREKVLLADLITAGYIEGQVIPNASGVPGGTIDQGVNVKGRLFLQKLEEKERDDSLRGRLVKWGLLLGGFIAGILATVLADWLKKKLGISN